MSESTVALWIPERHMLRLVQVNLERQRYRVLPTQSGTDLLALMAAEALIDLFVLDSDLRAPGIKELIAAIRADEKHSGARIIALGKDPDDDSDDSDLYITKPFTSWELFGGNGPGPTAGAVVCP